MNLLANSLWYLSSLPASVRFVLATRNVARVQQRKLLTLLRANASTAFGRRYGFADIQSVEQYQARVPLASYEDVRPWMERVEQGEQAVLTNERVLLLEPTSGSTSATKHIPYTHSLKREFQAGIAPWVTYTFSRHPGLFLGQSYWSVTPVIGDDRRTSGGIPIGFEDDSDYLSGLAGRVIRSLMAVPPEVKQIADLDSFRYVTLLFLLRSRSLSLISVWNPTFMTLLLEPIAVWWPRLVVDIATGSLSPPQVLPLEIRERLSSLNRADPKRATEIADIVGKLRDTSSEDVRGDVHRRLWPRLRLVSCWADANAAPYAVRLARLFPQAQIQPKGLVSTEAFVSFPIPGKAGSALSLNSHFYEFLPFDADASAGLPAHALTNTPTVLAHELEIGQRYSVVVTTGGGLYRYQLKDQIEVNGKLRDCPLMNFTGREDQVSDWFGEKLNEQHVRQVLTSLLPGAGLQPDFVMLACDVTAAPPAYTLYLQEQTATDDVLATLGLQLEQALQGNYHYAYCRRIGQLGELRVFRIEGDAAGEYLRGGMAQGQRAGDIKPTLLSRHGEWSSIFTGHSIHVRSP